MFQRTKQRINVKCLSKMVVDLSKGKSEEVIDGAAGISGFRWLFLLLSEIWQLQAMSSFYKMTRTTYNATVRFHFLHDK